MSIKLRIYTTQPIALDKGREGYKKKLVPWIK